MPLIDEKDVPEFTRDHKPFRFDLYRIPFNDGKGGRAVPIEGASANGQSNYFPKFSPDGKWIVFTKSDSYMLLQPDSELWILPASGGSARRLRYNTPRMNSWHSWSSNSRWLVFSSKANTPYTQLFLTHIDDDGNDTPPVLLEHFTSADRAANIPEFVRLSGDAIAEIKEEFLDAYSFLRAGISNEHTGDHVGAERALRRGLELDPNNVELHNALGWTLFQDARTPEAVAEYERALAIDPKHAKTHNNLGLALVELGRLQEAADHYHASVELEPKAEIMSDLGFTLARMDRFAEARDWYAKALQLDPRCASALVNLAVDAVRAGEYAQAEKYYREALTIKPNASTWNGLGYAERVPIVPAGGNLTIVHLREGVTTQLAIVVPMRPVVTSPASGASLPRTSVELRYVAATSAGVRPAGSDGATSVSGSEQPDTGSAMLDVSTLHAGAGTLDLSRRVVTTPASTGFASATATYTISSPPTPVVWQ